MKQVFEADERESPARVAADVLGYNYKESDNPLPTVPEEDAGHHSSEEAENPPDKDGNREMKDRLMLEIKEKISERRKRILQQRKELFNEGSSLDTSVSLEDVRVNFIGHFLFLSSNLANAR